MARKKEYNDEVVKLVKSRYDASKKFCQPYFDRFLDDYKHYLIRTIDEAIEADPESYPFFSTLSIPVSYQTVETILARMFAKLPSFTITTDQENDEQDEIALRDLIRKQMNHPYLVDDPIFTRLSNACKEFLITGNAWGEVPWQFEEAEVIEQQPYSIAMGIEPSWDNLELMEKYEQEPDWKPVKSTKTVIDAPVFHHRSIFHVFPDFRKKSLLEMEYIIFEDFMTKEGIQRMINLNPGKYKNAEVLKAMKPYGEASNDLQYDNEIASIFGSSEQNTSADTGTEPLYKVLFMRERNRFVVVVNEKLCIRDTGNPNGDGKLGFFLAKDIPIPGQLFGVGEVYYIKKIEDAMSDQANMRNDAVFYDLLRMWKIDPTAFVDGEEFYPEPGAIVQMTNLDGLEVVDTGTTDATAYKEYDEWEKILQNTTGVTDYATGASDPGMTDTASGIQSLQAAANARFAQKSRLFEEGYLKAMGTMYVQRNLLFFDTPEWVSVDGKKQLVQPSQIRRLRGNIDFLVDTGSSENINKEKELAKWKFISDSIADNKPPFDNLTQEAIDYVAYRLLYALGENHPEKIIIRNAPEVPPEETTAPADLEEAMAVAEASGMGPEQNAQENTEPLESAAPESAPVAETVG